MNKKQAPKSTLRFLRWFCPESLYESIEGDLLEQFDADKQAGGERKAKRKLLWNVLKFFKPEIILRNKFTFYVNRPSMIKNYLTVAYRNLARHKLYAFINIVGLSLGISACLLIGIYVSDEFSFDRFHEKSDKIFRVIMESNSSTIVQHIKYSRTPYPLADAIKESIPEAEDAVRVFHKNLTVKTADDLFDAKIIETDPGFFDMFSFPIMSQSTLRLLADSSEVAISQSAAIRYFHGEEPIGKIIQIREDTTFRDYKVAALLNDVPKNSSLQFDLAVRIKKKFYSNWRTSREETFVLLPNRPSLKDTENKILELFAKNGRTKNEISVMKIILEPISHMHFNIDTKTPYETTNPLHVALLITIGILILILAIVTFTTLTLSQSTTRAKEVGVRKTMGARKNQLVNQFYIETVMVACFAFLLGLLFTLLSLPAFNQLAGKSFSAALFQQPWFWISSVGCLLGTALLAGSYPAMFMSGFNPAKVVKKEFNVVSKQQLIKGLTAFQVILSFIFLTGAFIIHRQTEYVTNKNLGFIKDYVVRIPISMNEGLRTKAMLESELENKSSVRNIAASWQKFGAKDGVGYNYFPVKSGDQEVYGNSLGASEEFAPLFGLTLVQGNYFSKEHRGVLVNEALVRAFGWKDPIGRTINQMFTFDDPIVGVVRDFHYQSLHQSIEPLVIIPSQNYSNIFISFSGGEIFSNVELLKNVWSKIQPDIPFEFTFVDQDIQRHYEIEQRWQKVILYASILALIISCLGILGMANLTATRKTKEIGIRKVMGASIQSILVLLSKDYVRLILISFLIAFPLVHYFVSQWLTGFAYRIEVQWWMYILPGLTILSLALIAVCGQSWKVARVNPVETLKYE